MADYTTIRQDILNRITENGEGEITGLDLQGILLDMIDTTSVDINQMKQKLDDFFAASNLNDVIDNWTELESFLAGLTDTSTLVELLSYKADKVDVYTKTEADALFEFKANLKALAYKDSVSMGDISGLTDALALKLDKSGGTITGDLGVDGILTMGTLRLPNASGVSGNFDLYVGSLGSGSDIPEGGGGTISYVAIKFVGENTPYEIDANGVITLPPYPDISHLATKVELTEGLATKQDVISDLATIRAGATAGAAAATPGYVDQKIADLVGSAPETLDTLQELAEALQNDAEVIDAINASIQQKANQSDLTALATRVGTAEGAITTLQGYFSNGIAKKATADADGNDITTTYYRKDGGTIGGNAYVQGELTMNTLFLPNSSNVPSAYSLYVGSLGSGSDVPSSGGDGDTVVFTPIDSNYGTLSINGTQVGALSINGHTHSQYQLQITTSNKLAYSLISGTPTSLPASDVYAWAKAATKPSYAFSEITSKPTNLAGYGITDALPLSGGTITGDTDALKILRNSGGYSAITYYNTQNGVATVLGVMGFNSNGEPSAYRASDNTWRTLIHSGNIGSQSVNYANSAGYSDRLVSPYSYEGGTFINNDTTPESLFGSSYTFSAMMENCAAFGGYASVLNFTGYQQYGGTQLAVHYNNTTPRMALRNFTQESWKFTDWREIAFVDSNVASAQNLTHSNGTLGVTVTSGGKVLMCNALDEDDGTGLNVSGSILGKGLGYSSTITSSICGLRVGTRSAGHSGYNTGIAFNALSYPPYYSHSHAWIGLGPYTTTAEAECYPLVFATNGSTTTNTAPTERMRITPSGNVGIGTYSPSAKLDVVSGQFRCMAADAGTTYGMYHGFITGYHGIDVMQFFEREYRFYANGGESGCLVNVYGNISASGYQLPTSAPSYPVSGGYYLYVGSLGAGATIS